MTPEEYKAATTQIDVEANEKKKILNRQYAINNRQFVIGDIITDSQGSILISKYGISFDSNHLPTIYYIGVELKKDLTPTKAGKTRVIWPSHITSSKAAEQKTSN